MKKRKIKPRLNVVFWSGGKDSTATIILAHILGIKIDLIIMARLWFDKGRGIPAENQAHIDWVMNVAKPMFESWGYKVEFVSSDKDYIYWFNFVRKSSRKNPDTVGKKYGFLIGGACKMQGEKTIPAKAKLRSLKKEYDIVEYCGIAANETDRLVGVHKRKGQVSLLEQESMTTYDARRLCIKYGLLSPDYSSGARKRGGNCWFCPNQGIPEMAELKLTQPEKWQELKKLSLVENIISRGFRYGVPFADIEAKVDAYILNPPPQQLTFDFDSLF